MYPTPAAWGFPQPAPTPPITSTHLAAMTTKLSLDSGVALDSPSPHLASDPIDPSDVAKFRTPRDSSHALELVQHAHDNEGHFGTRAVHASLRRQGYLWRNMSAVIANVCNSCRKCLAWNSTKRIFHPLSSPQAVIPWDLIEMDLITSFQSDPGPLGEKYILIVTDVFSGFCLLRCLVDKTANSVAYELWKIFADFGPPRQIQSDNGGEFGADIIQQLIALYGATQRSTPSYNPRSAGKVERNVGTTSTTLRKLLHGTDLHWSSLLPAVQLAVNSKHQNLTNSSPFALVFNRVANNYQSVPNFDITSIPPSSYNDWLTREQRLHELVFPVINTRISCLQEASNHRFQPRATTLSKLPNGSLVMLKDPLVPRNKNSQPWLGPYTIVRSSRLGLYTLRDFAGGIYHRDVPRDSLKVVRSDSIATSEPNTYYVDELLDSRQSADGTT
jgi:transposase InsO family protein